MAASTSRHVRSRRLKKICRAAHWLIKDRNFYMHQTHNEYFLINPTALVWVSFAIQVIQKIRGTYTCNCLMYGMAIVLDLTIAITAADVYSHFIHTSLSLYASKLEISAYKFANRDCSRYILFFEIAWVETRLIESERFFLKYSVNLYIPNSIILIVIRLNANHTVFPIVRSSYIFFFLVSSYTRKQHTRMSLSEAAYEMTNNDKY